jgi:hypothetical protein
MSSDDYRRFLESKRDLGNPHGFEPLEIPEFLFPFQRSLVTWAIRKGRAALFCDCGMGKTPMQLVWADNVVRHTGSPVLILTPLAVSAQAVREADKFGIMAAQSRDGSLPSAPIVVTNYEKLKHFSPSDFSGVVCDESSILKGFGGATRAAITEFMRTIPYRLLCTATAAPNDYIELGTSAEALGEMGFQDMLTMFFKNTKNDETQTHHAWARQMKWILKGHARHDFWRWVCSWARACRKPSDLGFDDDRFVLPELITREHVVEARTRREGFLFDLPAVTLQDQREERRRTLVERCEKVAELVAHDRPALCWCHLNDEGDTLEELIPDAVQVSGKDSDESKEEKLLAFTSGQARVLVSKPSVFGFGLNLQHCAHETFFISHSFEQFYQAVRRCWRFGQTRPVEIDMVTTEGEMGVMANLQRKSEQADEMFTQLVELMHDHLHIGKESPFTKEAEIPSWVSSAAKAKIVRRGKATMQPPTRVESGPSGCIPTSARARSAGTRNRKGITRTGTP